MSARGLFITGTDTGIGKTRVSVGLLRALAQADCQAAGMKPVASGCDDHDGRLRNADALALQAAGSQRWPYDIVNPYAFAPPIAPHIAAEQAGVRLNPALLREAYDELAAASDWVVVEGVGGWRVPLAADYPTAALVRELGLPVILVVGLRLGCINHALLTAEAIAADGLECLGWVANAVDPGYDTLTATVATLAEYLPGPLLTTVPFAAADDHPCWERLADALTTAQNVS